MADIIALKKITREHALEVLIRNFDIADVKLGESEAAVRYNQEKIDIARQSIMAIPDDETKNLYAAWLDFFQGKTSAARGVA